MKEWEYKFGEHTSIAVTLYDEIYLIAWYPSTSTFLLADTQTQVAHSKYEVAKFLDDMWGIETDDFPLVREQSNDR